MKVSKIIQFGLCTYNSTLCTDITEETEDPHESVNTPGYCLKLPGKNLNLTALLYAKKFRYHGYKTGALIQRLLNWSWQDLGHWTPKKNKSGKVRIVTDIHVNHGTQTWTKRQAVSSE